MIYTFVDLTTPLQYSKPEGGKGGVGNFDQRRFTHIARAARMLSTVCICKNGDGRRTKEKCMYEINPSRIPLLGVEPKVVSWFLFFLSSRTDRPPEPDPA